jgi:hypothetical protein
MQKTRFHRWWPSLFRYDHRANPITALPIRQTEIGQVGELDDLIRYWQDYYSETQGLNGSLRNMRVAATIFYLQELRIRKAHD